MKYPILQYERGSEGGEDVKALLTENQSDPWLCLYDDDRVIAC